MFLGDVLSASFYQAISPKLKLLWNRCSHFVEGPQQHPGPQSPDPSTQELIPTLSSALAHSFISYRDGSGTQSSGSSSPAQPSPWQQGACNPPKELAPVQAPLALLMPRLPRCRSAGSRWLGAVPGSKGRWQYNPGRRREMAEARERRGTAEEDVQWPQRAWQKQDAPARGKENGKQVMGRS